MTNTNEINSNTIVANNTTVKQDINSINVSASDVTSSNANIEILHLLLYLYIRWRCVISNCIAKKGTIDYANINDGIINAEDVKTKTLFANDTKTDNLLISNNGEVNFSMQIIVPDTSDDNFTTNIKTSP